MLDKYYMVGIGASAGGLEAIELFFQNIKVDINVAYVIIQHFEPGHKTILPEILKKWTTLKILEIEDNMKIEPHTIYIVPAGTNVTLLETSNFIIEPPSAKIKSKYPVDVFFESLAENFEERGIGVILSGMGKDGSIGIECIKQKGGLAIVQRPDLSRYDAMPKSVIETGLVDYILSPENMPAQIETYIKWFTEKSFQIEDTSYYEKIYSIIYENTGHDFSSYKDSTIKRRIKREMAIEGILSLDNYVNVLEASPQKVEKLFKELLIGVTEFFRDNEGFEVIRKIVVPSITASKKPDESIRIWIPACSTGEEAYSMAILFKEYQELVNISIPIIIFATDINYKSLEFARKGVYHHSKVISLVSPEKIARFFIKEGDFYRIKKEIREVVNFSEQSLTRDPPFSNMDFISCRNILIYLEHTTQKRILEMFYFSLTTGGYLFLGNSENINNYSDLFIQVDKKWKIFQCPKEKISNRYFPSFLMNRNIEINEKIDIDKLPKSTFTLKQLSDKIIIEEYSPPSVIINTNHEIVYFHGKTGKYFEPIQGKASLNIFYMAKNILKMPLTTTLKEAFSEKKRVKVENIRFSDLEFINIKVIPFEYSNQQLYMIIFEEKSLSVNHSSVENISLPLEEQKDKYIYALEEELRNMRDYLQTTTEELDNSNEELKMANEELLSSNEELQSTNEELETSKEELQSVNEELMTLNSEIQEKNFELVKANNDLDNLFNSIELGIVFLDKELNILRFTSSVTDVINLIPSDLRRPLYHIVNNIENYDTMYEDLTSVMDSHKIIEKELKTKKGMFYQMRIIPYKNDNSNLIEGLIVTFNNISELKNTQTELERIMLLMETSFEQTSAALVIVSYPDLRIKLFNEACQNLLGISTSTREEYINTSLLDIKQVWLDFDCSGNPKTINEMPLFLALNGIKTTNYESIVQREDGSRIWIMTTGTPVYNKSGVLIAGLIVFTDITNKKKSENELIEAKFRAEEANKTKSQFLANMSHEIRTPLNGILGMAELVSFTTLTEEQKKYINLLKFSGESLLTVINDILDISKIESGKIELESTTFNLVDLIENTINTFSVSAAAKKLDLLSYIHPDATEEILGDPGRIRQILTNLIGNAIKFTERGEISVEIFKESEIDDKLTLKFIISDTGIGIPSEKLEKIFEHFYQIDCSNTRKYGGTGLGLSIAKKLVEMMNGHISVISKEGVGSQFIFTLELKSQNKSAIHKYEGFSELKILLFGNPGLVKLNLENMLSDFGCILYRSSTFDEFKNILETTSTLDMIVLLHDDIIFGNQDFIQLINSTEVNCIVVSSESYEKLNKSIRNLKQENLLSKPVKFRELEKAVLNQASLNKVLNIINHFASSKSSNAKILLVEDNSINLETTRIVLDKFGLEVLCAENGEAAIEILKQEFVDVVLMDIEMPVMDGISATKIIRTMDNCKDIPIIALTAYALRGDKDRCIGAGMNDYISKPYKAKELYDLIMKYVK